ncbi:MAG: hypothetical protein PHV75_03115 [Victivallaceae bacterium]|jgi:hypothetical protein|nr:hypothetical protein [Victivallaceae bacterium]MDD3117048.1 hypothetical protein [Victivallaceae bacterium]MDD4317487.1 hypothetical protein [Victivallaceae bacterium]MDD5664372.1 hypothetical protein [Victivallaceae bacterium]
MEYCKLEIYVPADYAESVKQAAFEAGAGKLGNYECCCWQTTGTGQFRPLPGSAPYIGSHDKLEQVEEIKLEMICPGELLNIVIDAVRHAHPYETPAFQYWPVKLD